jgi:glyoxylase-like metal-dependent hydrolase (beta-lactamase superfamily II)
MNSRLLLVIVLCIAMLGAYVHGRQGGPPQASKLDIVKVKDDLFVIHNEFVPGNTTAMITTEGVILVDDKFDVDYQNIMTMLKTVTNQPVRYVINTHHHGDHSGGNARMQGAGAVVVASENARQNMADGRQPGPPTVTFDRQAYLTLGNKRVELYYFGRAHTNGDIVAYFPAQRALAAGDMFTYGDATPQLIDYAGGGSAKEWTKTLDGVLGLDFDTAVPGHGNVTTKAEMRKFRDSTLAVRNRVRELIVKKAPRDEIAKVLQSEFHWGQLQMDRSLDGMLVELR